MKEEEKRKILEEHKYKIFQGKDGRWKTTVLDETVKSGRRIIAKTNKDEFINEVVNHYKIVLNDAKKDEKITLEYLYPLWLQSRKLEVNCIGTVKKNDQDWKRYYINDEIIKIPIKDLTVQELKDWAHKKIIVHNFNKRDYYNMAIIIKQCFQYAFDSGLIHKNTWSEVKINKNKLRFDAKKPSDTEVFLEEDKKKLIQYSFYMFHKNSRNISALAIPLLFVTGLRIGELVSLRYSDIMGDSLFIHQAESVIYTLDGEGTFSYTGKRVLDHTKTKAGERYVPLTNDGKGILSLIKESSKVYGLYDDDFIFCPNSKRINANTIDKKLYNYCSKIGIDKKSAHKIRKTYISTLIHSGEIDIDTICRVAGHIDMRTTFTSYCYSLDTDKVIRNKFENTISLTFVKKSVNKCKQIESVENPVKQRLISAGKGT